MNRKKTFNLRHLLLIILVVSITFLLKPSHTVNANTFFDGADFNSIDAYVETEMKAQHIPGLALAIVKGDEIVHLHEFGIADPSGKKITPQTPFIIGSLSKSFTAMAIMQLVEAGKIELDAPIKQYLNWFYVANGEVSSSITVRNLLNQNSGLAGSTGLNDETSRDMGDNALENRVRSFQNAHLNRPVGNSFEYSNANYDILGLIVQTVSGQPYDSYIQENIFNPLEMHHSYVSEIDATKHGLATGYRFWFGKPLPFIAPYPRASLPHGYLIASVEDMSHYLISYLNEGRYGDKSLISQAGIDTMLMRPLQEKSDFYYGMGWFVGQKNGIQMMRHGGDVANFHANMILVPEGKWGVVLLENAENYMASEHADNIADGVAALLVGQQPVTADPGSFLQTIFAAILIIFTIQIIVMIVSAVVMRHWQKFPTHIPHSWFGKFWRIISPTLLNLIIGLLFLVGIPAVFERTLPIIVLYLPDLGYTLIFGGIVALIWAFIWTAWAIFVLRTSVKPAL